jgi:hypothetical protein
LLAALLLAVLPGQAVGGVATHGAGFGTYRTNDGSVVCPGAPFVVEVAYLPDGRGSMHSEFDCGTTVGTTAILGGARVDTTRTPPVELVFFCAGAEATGMRCEAQAGPTLITADVGPYAGPGSTVTLSTRGGFMFDGSFTAV